MAQENKKVAVFGLGSMGMGMALSLAKPKNAQQNSVWGIDINPSAEEKFRNNGGMSTPLELSQLDAVIMVVVNGAQTQELLLGKNEDNGILAQLKTGTVVVSSATMPPDQARQFAKVCFQSGVLFLDAPISGGAVKAAQGKLTMMVSGSDDSFRAAKPLLDSMAETVFNLGDQAGAGSAMKAVNQLLAGVHIATMAEAMTFGITQGISPEVFLKVIPQCAGTSWMLENRAPHIVNGDYTAHSAINIWPKDLGIVMNIAKQAHFHAPIATAALKQYWRAAEQGLGAQDDAAIAKIYAKDAGITLPKTPNDPSLKTNTEEA